MGFTDELELAREVLTDPRTLALGDGRYERLGTPYRFSTLILDAFAVDATVRCKAHLKLGASPWIAFVVWRRRWWHRLFAHRLDGQSWHEHTWGSHGRR